MVSRIICVLAIVAVANAATYIGGLERKPVELAHKKGCYIKEIHDVIPFGAELTALGSCYRIECTRHRVDYATCPTISTDDPKCYVTDMDLSRPYPHCCPDIQCDLDNNI